MNKQIAFDLGTTERTIKRSPTKSDVEAKRNFHC